MFTVNATCNATPSSNPYDPRALLLDDSGNLLTTESGVYLIASNGTSMFQTRSSRFRTYTNSVSVAASSTKRRLILSAVSISFVVSRASSVGRRFFIGATAGVARATKRVATIKADAIPVVATKLSSLAKSAISSLSSTASYAASKLTTLVSVARSVASSVAAEISLAKTFVSNSSVQLQTSPSIGKSILAIRQAVVSSVADVVKFMRVTAACNVSLVWFESAIKSSSAVFATSLSSVSSLTRAFEKVFSRSLPIAVRINKSTLQTFFADIYLISSFGMTRAILSFLATTASTASSIASFVPYEGIKAITGRIAKAFTSSRLLNAETGRKSPWARS